MDMLKTLYETFRGYLWWGCVAWICREKLVAKPVVGEGHVALLAWTFPPAVSGGVYRPLSLARYSVELGWKISIISGSLRDNPTSAGLSLLESLPKEVIVHRVETENAPRPSYNWFPRIDGGFINGLNLVKTAMRELADDPPSVIAATGPPFHSFMAAFYLARFFGAKLILDYRDEWTECPFSFTEKGNFDRWWERRCLEKADAVIFTTRSQLEHNRSTFNGGDSKKFHLIPNGWEPTDFVEAKTEKSNQSCRNSSDSLVLSFIGALGDHTLPGPFLVMLEKILKRRSDLLDRVKLQFIGTRSPKSEEQLSQFLFPKNLMISNHVTKKDANRLMGESNALLVFYDESFARYIPGKFYDYLASGRPIVVVGDRGEVPDLLRGFGGGGWVVAEEDDKGLEAVLDQLTDEGIIAPEIHKKIEPWLKQYTRARMASDFFEKIQSL